MKKFNNKFLKKILFTNGSISFLKINNFKKFQRFENDLYNKPNTKNLNEK